MLLRKGLCGPLKDSSFPNKKSLADLLLGRKIFLPNRPQKISHFVAGMKWVHLKGK